MKARELLDSMEESAPTKFAVKNVKKTFNMFADALEEAGLKIDFTNPSMHFTFEIKGKTFNLTIHDNWMNVGIGNSEVGSAIDKRDMPKLIEYIRKNTK